VTLNQLKVFVLIVRLGSFKAAANALGVSEPAVAQAISALRQSLGDQLLNRGSGGIELTPAGQRIVGLASQMVTLATEAEDAVRQAQGGPALLRVVSTATPGEAVVPALLQAFSTRAGSVEAELGIANTDEMAALLSERLADVAIGPSLAGAGAPGIVSEPLLRYRLTVVARTSHPLLRSGSAVPRAALTTQEWLVDPSGSDPRSDVGQLLATIGVSQARVSVFPDARAAWAAAASGDGVAPAVEHLFAHQLQPALSIVPVAGMHRPTPLSRHTRRHAGNVSRRRPRARVTIQATGLRHHLELSYRLDSRTALMRPRVAVMPFCMVRPRWTILP
jgi:LysR family transcriptional regulator, low CO2-responsive transcriptional regulator